jgi:hypothetical protein
VGSEDRIVFIYCGYILEGYIISTWCVDRVADRDSREVAVERVTYPDREMIGGLLCFPVVDGTYLVCPYVARECSVEDVVNGRVVVRTLPHSGEIVGSAVEGVIGWRAKGVGEHP